MSSYDLSICWSKGWVKNYESSWSIFEKIKLSNSISGKDLESGFFVLEQYSYFEDVVMFYLDNNVYVDCKKFERIIGLDLSVQQKFSLNLNRGRKYREKLKFSNYLNICNKCIKRSYHSYLHQSNNMVCPFHNEEKLGNRCPKCNLLMKFNIISKFEPFACKCGYLYCDSFDNRVWDDWSRG